MELRTLRYFVAVVDSGSVTAAARETHVAQPSLSRQLRRLERDLGVTLFERRGGRLVPSAAGRQFLPAARDVLARADAVREAAAGIAAGRLEHLTIAAPGTTLTDVIAPFLATTGPDDPLPAVREVLPRNVYAELGRGADLAIGTRPPPGGLDGLPVADLPVWAYVPERHGWHGRATVPLAELAAEPLLVPTDDFHPRQALDQAMAEARLRYRSLLELGTPPLAQALAAAGRGVAVVSDDPRFGLHPIRIETGRGVSRPEARAGGEDTGGEDGRPAGMLHISLYAAWDPAHHGASVLARLARRLRNYCIERYGPSVAPGPMR